MSKNLFYILGRCFAYRSISHPEMRLYTCKIPLSLTGILMIFYWILPLKPAFLGSNGLFSSSLSFITTLPGFYLAGLAAIATFGNPTIDQEMAGTPPEIEILIKGKKTSIKLTRRQFLSYLFSYLTTISFCLCCIFLLLNNLTENITYLHKALTHSNTSLYLWVILKNCVIFSISFLFSSLITSSLHALYYLTERIHLS